MQLTEAQKKWPPPVGTKIRRAKTKFLVARLYHVVHVVDDEARIVIKLWKTHLKAWVYCIEDETWWDRVVANDRGWWSVKFPKLEPAIRDLKAEAVEGLTKELGPDVDPREDYTELERELLRRHWDSARKTAEQIVNGPTFRKLMGWDRG